jgi:ribosomal protein L7/L12
MDEITALHRVRDTQVMDVHHNYRITGKDIIDHLAAAYRQRLAAGLSQDDLIAELHVRGFSTIDAIKIVRQACAVSLSDAKEYVHGHAAWHTEAQRAAAFHEALLAALEQELAQSTGDDDDDRLA